eukprot:TRINITY_DN1361_c0_g1_i6.p1 TRINITY_DN1361_c0_g1~~TRINITY_DN1361_c0_g1_i6.p1  ORF type:complete len:122 (-),score=36.68 TRINITY_DN1361_c0_g1_i6:271-636(-)
MASARGAESTGKHARPANGTKGNGEKRGRRRMTAEKARRGSMGRAEKQREKQITARKPGEQKEEQQKNVGGKWREQRGHQVNMAGKCMDGKKEKKKENHGGDKGTRKNSTQHATGEGWGRE